MTRTEFKSRWESGEDGGGITFEDIAKCAELWGLISTPRIRQIDHVRYMVLKAAGTDDADDFKPEKKAL